MTGGVKGEMITVMRVTRSLLGQDQPALTEWLVGEVWL